MKIGIRWKGNWDLDLYAKPHVGAETLFFQQTRSAEGYYFKDHRSSPGREYEYIEFTEPVDVYEVKAMVNFYKGMAANGAAGEVRVEFEGRVYTGTFAIPSTQGNRGRLDETQSQFWATVEIPGLMHLPARARVAAAEDRDGTL